MFPPKMVAQDLGLPLDSVTSNLRWGFLADPEQAVLNSTSAHFEIGCKPASWQIL
jgi:hypothetical protein